MQAACHSLKLLIGGAQLVEAPSVEDYRAVNRRHNFEKKMSELASMKVVKEEKKVEQKKTTTEAMPKCTTFGAADLEEVIQAV